MILSTTTGSARHAAENNLELAAANEKPKIQVILAELEQAQTDASGYYSRQATAYDLWHARWSGQSADGRKHLDVSDDDDVWPFEGASDTRVRLAEKLVRQHITVSKYAIMQAKVQAQSTRPSVDALQSHQATTLLKWMLWTHQRAEMQRELPLYLAWLYGYGASFIGVDWEQARRTDFVKFALPDLADYIDQAGGDGGGESAMLALMDAISDPAQEEYLADLLIALTPILTRGKARKLVFQLRTKGQIELPLAYVFKSKPRITALRPGVDLIIPAETSDIQAARFVDWIERVTETELTDRIETEDYKEDFVEEALKHKGDSMVRDSSILQRTATERTIYAGGSYPTGPASETTYRDMIELHHVHYKALYRDVPCMYRTTIAPFLLEKARNRDNPLYAKHGLFPYQHGEYPIIVGRNEHDERAILSSRGVPEIAYTWENEIKVQRDGRTDRTAFTLRPPLIVPHSREKMIKNTPIPGAVLGVTRPNEIQWMPQPQPDQTPIEIERTVSAAADEYFALFGADVDPDLKNLRRAEIAYDRLGEIILVLAMEYKLMQQFLPDDEVAQTVGELQRPFRISREEIQEAHQITVAFDARELDKDYLTAKIKLVGEVLMMDTAGVVDHARLVRWALQSLDPDMAAEIVSDVISATNREIQNEREAVSRIVGSGIPEALPEAGNFEVRLKALQDALAENPALQPRLQGEPDKLQVLANRVEYFQNQLQQRENARIGKFQVTQPFSKKAPMAALPS